jgi:hypothetical protein
MLDLSQHAGQVALLRDLLAGTSRWSDVVHINYFTPYVLGYSLALVLSFVFPLVTALKVLLTLTYWAFVAAAVALRRELGADPRLDWMFLPVFFGFSFDYGLLNFLVAAPVGLYFLLLSKRYAEQCALGTGGGSAMGRVLAAGVLLYYSHGLTFAFGVATGACMVLVKVVAFGTRRAGHGAIRALAPYAVLGLVLVAYAVALRLNEPMLAQGDNSLHFEWRGGRRAYDFFSYVMATGPGDRALFAGVLLLMAAPWAMGCRPSRDPLALVPVGAMVAVWLFMPSVAAKTHQVYQRFSLFWIPAYAVAFCPPRTEPSPARGRAALLSALAVQALLALSCMGLMGVVALRVRRFATESAPFEAILAAAEPGERALAIVCDPHSAAARFEWEYNGYPLWYQAERKGFVDFNYAYFHPEIVRFRPGQTPPIEENLMGPFNWHELHASIYRYFFVRHTAPVPAGLFDNDQCQVDLVRAEGDWALYERRSCRY